MVTKKEIEDLIKRHKSFFDELLKWEHVMPGRKIVKMKREK